MPVVIRTRSFDQSFYKELMDSNDESAEESKSSKAEKARLELFGA
jgi:hypothetical protein